MYSTGIEGLPVTAGSGNSQVVSNPDPENPVIRDAQESADFMTLMIEQLKNQDPLNPMQSNEFTMQLAALNSLEATIEMKSLLEESLASTQLSEAIGMIGGYVEGVDADSNYVTGYVDRVEVIEGAPVLVVDDSLLLLDQVYSINDYETEYE